MRLDTISINENDVIRLKRSSPSDIVVTNGESWKCPVYARKMPPCRSSCPSSEDIRGYLTSVARSGEHKRPPEDAFDEAWHILTDKNPFPAVHGRICPHPCEEGCNRQYKEDGPVSIKSFERFVGDHGIRRGLSLRKLTDRKRDRRVAVIGAGPSGLSCAYQLARRGYPVTVFESLEKPGGMLRYGITSYRLPREVLDAEIQKILDLGVELKCNMKIGKNISLTDLKKKYDAIYMAVGAQRGSRLNIEGEDIPRVFSGVDFLHRINSGEKMNVGERVVVIGGGNTAIDASRVCRRLGAEATIIYRRTGNEMPALKDEIRGAEEEGVQFEFLTAPTAIYENGRSSVFIKCLRMKLGEKDRSGRHRPVPEEGSDFVLEAETVLVAIGNKPDLTNLEGPEHKEGRLEFNQSTRETSVAGIFTGGDVLETANATTAVGHGRRAAKSIEAYLNGIDYKDPRITEPLHQTDMILDYYPPMHRNDVKELQVEERTDNFKEVCMPLSTEEAVAESQRCMSCGLCFACNQCLIYCPRTAISSDKNRPVGQIMFTDYTKCNGCHICAEVCPCGYIEMGMGL